jgi:hypothetical protein
MEVKQMMIADLNVVFGKNEEPLLVWMDDIMLPALQSGIVREANEDTRYLFDECIIYEYGNDLVLRGILIKDTVLDVKSEYTNEGLKKANKRFPYSPYSIFMIFLRNHRMILVKNQSESPDIRSFKASLWYLLRTYIRQENSRRKKEGESLLPHVVLNVSGIKTSQSVKRSLEDVEKITELTFKFYPLNAEWDYDPIFGGIDSKIRKVINARGGRMTFPSPESKQGVADVIEQTEGLVKTTMKVQYKADSEKGRYKKKGTIKDNEISDVSSIEINAELDDAFDEVYGYKNSFKSLNVESKNNVILYEEYMKNRKK